MRSTEPSLVAACSAGLTRRTPDGLAYAIRGEGAPLLLLSGYGVSSRGLSPLVDVLAEQFTCLTFDYRGTGKSAFAFGRVTTGSMARDAARVLHDADVVDAHVVGVSLGGMVAQELAIQRPDLVRGLVLVATTAGGWSASSPGLGALRSALAEASGVVPGGVDVRGRMAVRHAWAATLHDTSTRLGRVAAPTLVAHGESDSLVTPAGARMLADRIARAELRVVPGGHLFLFDEDRSHVRTVGAWLAALPEPATGAPEPSCRAGEPVERALSFAFSPMLPGWRALRAVARTATRRDR
jgi:3-oxoadipate enol-lactonase